jgi:hypothetical protein
MENMPISRIMYRPPKKMFQIWKFKKKCITVSKTYSNYKDGKCKVVSMLK